MPRSSAVAHDFVYDPRQGQRGAEPADAKRSSPRVGRPPRWASGGPISSWPRVTVSPPDAPMPLTSWTRISPSWRPAAAFDRYERQVRRNRLRERARLARGPGSHPPGVPGQAENLPHSWIRPPRGPAGPNWNARSRPCNACLDGTAGRLLASRAMRFESDLIQEEGGLYRATAGRLPHRHRHRSHREGSARPPDRRARSALQGRGAQEPDRS